MIDLKNKTILITGASSGIGRATALLCDQLGASLIICGRKREELENTAAGMKQKPQLIIADLSSEEQIKKFCAELPALDGIVNAAGIIQPLPVKFIRGKNIDELFRINFSAAVLLSSHLLSEKKIKPEASVIFISSISSEHPYTGGALYSSSKAALEAFSKTMALECAPRKIRVNTIAPALVKTGIWKQAEEIYSKEEVEEIERRYPLGIGEPKDVANCIAFLLSPASSWITGTLIKMDGGLLLNNKI